MSSLLDNIAKAYRDQITPLVNDGVKNFINFIIALNSDPVNAANFAMQALVAVFCFILTTYYLWKVTRRINSILSSVAILLIWILSICKKSASYAERILSILIQKILWSLIWKRTYSGFFSWCAMLPRSTEIFIVNNYKDGETFVSYQRNLGAAVLVLSIWSAASFGYAVYSALNNFGQSNGSASQISVCGAVIYGMLIFLLDRSIVAPTSLDNDIVLQSSMFNFSDAFKHFFMWLKDAGIKIIGRFVIAWYVAHFTAIPITILLLNGGIVAELNSSNDQKRIAAKKALSDRQGNRTKEINDKPASANCIESKNQVNRINAELERNFPECGNSKNCIRDIKKQKISDRRSYELMMQTACTISSNELKIHDDLIEFEKDDVKSVKDIVNPDILQGAKTLDILRKKELENDGMFRPIGATFNLLFIIELLPALMKIWRDKLVNRRIVSDRRSRPPGMDRRIINRRK